MSRNHGCLGQCSTARMTSVPNCLTLLRNRGRIFWRGNAYRSPRGRGCCRASVPLAPSVWNRDRKWGSWVFCLVAKRYITGSPHLDTRIWKISGCSRHSKSFNICRLNQSAVTLDARLNAPPSQSPDVSLPRSATDWPLSSEPGMGSPLPVDEGLCSHVYSLHQKMHPS